MVPIGAMLCHALPCFAMLAAVGSRQRTVGIERVDQLASAGGLRLSERCARLVKIWLRCVDRNPSRRNRVPTPAHLIPLMEQVETAIYT